VLDRLVDRLGERREVAHLAAGPARAAAQSGSRAAWPPVGNQQSPSRFAIAAGATSRVEPSGRPHTARTCCSNWLVSQASIVRWPELCVRGAISLTRTRPFRVTKNSTQATPTTSSAARIFSVVSTAAVSTGCGRSAGTLDTSRMWWAWEFRDGANAAVDPSSPRAATTEISQSKSIQPSSTSSRGPSGPPPRVSQAASTHPGSVSFTWPLPS
jgi:hypothetical protein